VSSDLVKAYHMGRPGVQIVSEPWWRQDSVSEMFISFSHLMQLSVCKDFIEFNTLKHQMCASIKWVLKCEHIKVQNVLEFPLAFKEQVYNATVELMHL
jgi:hypothetical protein